MALHLNLAKLTLKTVGNSFKQERGQVLLAGFDSETSELDQRQIHQLLMHIFDHVLVLLHGTRVLHLSKHLVLVESLRDSNQVAVELRVMQLEE